VSRLINVLLLGLSIPGIGSIGIGTIAKFGIALLLLYWLWKPIVIAIFIFVYELLLRTDLYGSIKSLSKVLLSKHEAGLSLLPQTEGYQNAEEKRTLYSLDSPIKALLNINRGILYTAFFVTLITSFPISLFFSISWTTVGAVFHFLNGIIAYEALVIMIFFSLVVADKISDILITLGGMFR